MSITASGPVAGLVAGALLTAGGFFMAFSIGKPIRDQAAASVTWPTTEGRITRAQLERSISKGKTMYSADIAYDYQLDGKPFEGGRVWMGNGSSSSDPTPFRRAVERYPAGTAVRVHYDPADPAESVLEPGVTWASSFLYFFGLGVLAVGGMILLSALVPLLLVAAALAGFFAPKGDDAMRDFDRPVPPSTDPDDDGITIG